jgi:hypothetical protein
MFTLKNYYLSSYVNYEAMYNSSIYIIQKQSVYIYICSRFAAPATGIYLESVHDAALSSAKQYQTNNKLCYSPKVQRKDPPSCEY